MRNGLTRTLFLTPFGWIGKAVHMEFQNYSDLADGTALGIRPCWHFTVRYFSFTHDSCYALDMREAKGARGAGAWVQEHEIDRGPLQGGHRRHVVVLGGLAGE